MSDSEKEYESDVSQELELKTISPIKPRTRKSNNIKCKILTPGEKNPKREKQPVSEKRYTSLQKARDIAFAKTRQRKELEKRIESGEVQIVDKKEKELEKVPKNSPVKLKPKTVSTNFYDMFNGGDNDTSKFNDILNKLNDLNQVLVETNKRVNKMYESKKAKKIVQASIKQPTSNITSDHTKELQRLILGMGRDKKR